MARVRLDFQSITLFEEEDWGATHVALYATVKDAADNVIGTFRWNNRNGEVDEVRTYGLDNDLSFVNAIFFELDGFATLSVEAYADSDENWPTADDSENFLGGASIVFDPRDPATLGQLSLGPTETDDDNTGYLVDAFVRVVPPTAAGDVRIKFDNLVLYDDEDFGATHMAIYVFARGPGIDREIFRWNNGDEEVEAADGYGLGNSPNPTEQTFTLTGPTAFYVESWADSDEDWPRSDENEDFLGSAMFVVDPGDPATNGRRKLGPTNTEDDNTGYALNVSMEMLPATADPDLSIDRIEITQAIQFSNSTNGADNSLPLVANKRTLVRVYLDSGVEAAINGGAVAGVTGTLTATGSASFTLAPVAPFTAKPLPSVDPNVITDTLNFIIPPEQANGTLRITVQATVGANVSNPVQAVVTFVPVGVLDILMVRVRTRTAGAPDQATYFANMNQLPLIYPIPTSPGSALRYWILPGSEEVFADHDLTNDDGMGDFLDDLEDIQEESADHKKLYGMTSAMAAMARTGTSREGDNVSFGLPFLMTAVGHELGHVYGLDHAPFGTPGNQPEDTDDDFKPNDASLGDVGVDVAAMVTMPAATKDFMSYGGTVGSLPYENLWVSGYHWTKLFDKFRDL
jgi:hypothetical protein